MAIWFDPELSVQKLESRSSKTLDKLIGIEFTEVGENYLKARMPVNERTKQAYGILHGGASVTLAETVGSVASVYILDPSKQYCVGLEISANHIRSASEGYVEAIASPLHIGGSTHVWDIRITDQAGKLICVSRLTMAILNKK